jgi:hypothetical protein
MDEAIETFVGFTGATPEIARRYLGFTENDPQQAIQLFFDSPDLASGIAPEAAAPPIPTASRPHQPPTSSGSNLIDLDSDDDMDIDSDEETARAAALSRAADVEDDEAMARRMQEELYAGGDGAGGMDADGVRAPIARRTETLVGGPDDSGYGQAGYMDASVAQQLRYRQRQQAGSSSKSRTVLGYLLLLIKYQTVLVFSINEQPQPHDQSGMNQPTKEPAVKDSQRLQEAHQKHRGRLLDLRSFSDLHLRL